MPNLPRIDSSIDHIGTSVLRFMGAAELRTLDKVVVIHDTQQKPLAVLFPYSRYMEMQAELDRLLEEVERPVAGRSGDA